MLYPKNRKDLKDYYSRKVGDLWLADNIGGKEINTIICEASKAAEIEFGLISDLKL